MELHVFHMNTSDQPRTRVHPAPQTAMDASLQFLVHRPGGKQHKDEDTHNDTILPDLDMVPDLCGLDDSIRTDMYVVPNLHGVIVEISTICLIWRPVLP